MNLFPRRVVRIDPTYAALEGSELEFGEVRGDRMVVVRIRLSLGMLVPIANALHAFISEQQTRVTRAFDALVRR